MVSYLSEYSADYLLVSGVEESVAIAKKKEGGREVETMGRLFWFLLMCREPVQHLRQSVQQRIGPTLSAPMARLLAASALGGVS